MHTLLNRRRAFLALICLTSLPGLRLVAQSAKPPRFENEIVAFEAHDRTNFPPKNAILFLGSSSIRKWTTLSNDFPGKEVINRGFGGSEISESIAYADRIVFPYEPRIIVFYAGDNDLAAGKSVERVVSDYKELVTKIHERLPKTRILFISIKPCPARWKQRDKVGEVNKQIAAMKEDYLGFINVYPLMLGDDDKPLPDLFQKDGLHPNEKCYKLWASQIRPELDK